jgi:small subunit ribosomal protein S28e
MPVAGLSPAGSRGGVTQVKAEFLGDSHRSLLRNVKINDILSLLETEREAGRFRETTTEHRFSIVPSIKSLSLYHMSG